MAQMTCLASFGPAVIVAALSVAYFVDNTQIITYQYMYNRILVRIRKNMKKIETLTYGPNNARCVIQACFHYCWPPCRIFCTLQPFYNLGDGGGGYKCSLHKKKVVSTTQQNIVLKRKKEMYQGLKTQTYRHCCVLSPRLSSSCCCSHGVRTRQWTWWWVPLGGSGGGGGGCCCCC